MKLYDCPRDTWVKLKEATTIPPAAPTVGASEEIYFCHIDGMYSFCLNKKGDVVHIAAWTDVEICKDQKKPPKRKYS